MCVCLCVCVSVCVLTKANFISHLFWYFSMKIFCGHIYERVDMDQEILTFNWSGFSDQTIRNLTVQELYHHSYR